MPNPLNTIRKNGTVYILLTPDESFFIGQSDGKPCAFLFSMKKFATAYREIVGKPDLVISKEEARPLMEELVELGVNEAFIDADKPTGLPEPLLLPKYIEHLAKQEKEAGAAT